MKPSRLGIVGALACLSMLNSCQAHSVPRPGQDTCGARKLKNFIGSYDSPKVREAIRAKLGIRPDQEELLPGQPIIRWIRPGDVIIANFSSGRLNVGMNSDGEIVGFGCY